MRLNATSLSSAELLTLIIGQGSHGHDLLSISEALLQKYQSLGQIFHLSPAQWQQSPGLGPAGYCRLQAALELNRRKDLESAAPKDHLSDFKAAQAFCFSQLNHYEREVFACIFLNKKQDIIAFEPLFFGTIDSTNVYPREVIKRGLFHNSAQIICCHNHPSGNLKPSQADIELTVRLFEALSIVDIELIDHILVCSNGCLSIPF